MNVVRSALFAAFCFVFLPSIVDGINCYYCLACLNPFDKDNATIVSTNSSTESCYKAVVGSVSTRGSMDNCVESNVLGVGTWCCNTNLCNSAESIVPISTKIFIGFFFFVSFLFK